MISLFSPKIIYTEKTNKTTKQNETKQQQNQQTSSCQRVVF